MIGTMPWKMVWACSCPVLCLPMRRMATPPISIAIVSSQSQNSDVMPGLQSRL